MKLMYLLQNERATVLFVPIKYFDPGSKLTKKVKEKDKKRVAATMTSV